jgi:hypothetical protein
MFYSWYACFNILYGSVVVVSAYARVGCICLIFTIFTCQLETYVTVSCKQFKTYSKWGGHILYVLSWIFMIEIIQRLLNKLCRNCIKWYIESDFWVHNALDFSLRGKMEVVWLEWDIYGGRHPISKGTWNIEIVKVRKWE